MLSMVWFAAKSCLVSTSRFLNLTISLLSSSFEQETWLEIKERDEAGLTFAFNVDVSGGAQGVGH